MQKFNFDEILNCTLNSLDYRLAISGVADFLDFSEGNLSWQKRRELRKAELDASSVIFPPEDEHYKGQYIIQMIEGVEHRFDVTLAQNIRYSGLVSLITAVEWCATSFKRRLVVPLPSKANGNDHVHLFSWLNEKSKATHQTEINTISKLIHVRNCIVHNSGLLAGWGYENEIRSDVSSLNGISISDNNYIGECISISEGAIQLYAAEAISWIPQFEEPCIKAGLIK